MVRSIICGIDWKRRKRGLGKPNAVNQPLLDLFSAKSLNAESQRSRFIIAKTGSTTRSRTAANQILRIASAS
jgi:hypothetical protein